MMVPEPQKEHEWLMQLVGDWVMEGECVGPGEEKIGHTGRETVRALGNLWIVAEGESALPDGSPAYSRYALGYDIERGHYTGVFIASVMSGLWTYKGHLDETGRMLVLDTQGPSPEGDGRIANYRDSYEIVDADHRILRSEVEHEDGMWMNFLTAHYRRV